MVNPISLIDSELQRFQIHEFSPFVKKRWKFVNNVPYGKVSDMVTEHPFDLLLFDLPPILPPETPPIFLPKPLLLMTMRFKDNHHHHTGW